MTTQNESNDNDVTTMAEQLTQEDNLSSDFLISSSGARYSIHLFKTIHEIEMPIRAHNAFVRANIIYLGDLISVPYRDFVLMPNLGKKTLDSVAASIEKLGLKFDMAIEAWPPADLIYLREQYETKICKKAL
jgi:DNA-directed RNA polymerase alpha subunit